MQFKIGEMAVYPAQGVAEVTGVEVCDLGGHTLNCYVLHILATGATVMVPISSCERAGMRKLMQETEIEEIYNILKMPAQCSQGTWNKRSRKLQQKLRSGSMSDMAEVLRDLSAQQENKGLSFGEKQMLNKCRELVVAEISIASKQTSAVIESNISNALAYH